MINIFFIHRVSAVASVQHELDRIAEGHLTVNGHDIRTVGHDILGTLVPEFKNIGYHLRFAGLDYALLMAFIYHGNDLFLRHINACLLYTSDAADDLLCVDIGGPRIIKKKQQKKKQDLAVI